MNNQSPEYYKIRCPKCHSEQIHQLIATSKVFGLKLFCKKCNSIRFTKRRLNKIINPIQKQRMAVLKQLQERIAHNQDPRYQIDSSEERFLEEYD